MQLILAQLLDEGDPFLVEEYTYSHILESVAEPKGYVPVGVPMDRDGLLPDALRHVRGRLHLLLAFGRRAHIDHVPVGLVCVRQLNLGPNHALDLVFNKGRTLLMCCSGWLKADERRTVLRGHPCWTAPGC